VGLASRVRPALCRYRDVSIGQCALKKAGSPAGHGHGVERDADLFESLPLVRGGARQGTDDGRAGRRPCPRAATAGRRPKMTPELTGKAQRMYDARTFTMAEIAASCGVTPMTIYRNITVRPATSEQPLTLTRSRPAP
jgi:hypothetical protein